MRSWGGFAGGWRLEFAVGIAAAVVSVAPLATDHRLHSPAEWLGGAGVVGGSLLLAGWRRFPVPVLAVGPLLLLLPLWLGPDPSNFLLLTMTGYAALAAERYSGRAAWAAAAACAGYVMLLYVVSGDYSIGIVMLTLPGFLAGTAVRLRRETGEALAERGRELELERELFAELTVRNERVHIAAELHDIVGHALSVMVVQAAAGQRLVDRAPDQATASLAVIAESAREGRADLQRLIDLLVGGQVADPELGLVEELIERAARSGLPVTLRLEGECSGLDDRTAHMVYRVVQESLTNALRHAQGAQARVLLHGDRVARTVTVRVDNDPATGPARHPVTGGGRGLIGLRERVLALGGTFTAGPSAPDGWTVEAVLRDPPRVSRVTDAVESPGRQLG